MARALVLFALAFLLLGCTTPAGPTATSTPASTVTASPSSDPTPQTPTFSPAYVSPTPDASNIPSALPPGVLNQPPSISTTASPSNPDRGQPFVLTVSSKDDLGLKTLSWESADPFSLKPESNVFDCGSQKNCTVSWTFKAALEGDKTITAHATDTSGLTSAKSPVKFSVRPFDYKEPSPTPIPTAIPSGPVCGNAVCDAKEAFETCPGDCPYAGFACANGKCEGGESYQSCPQDCSVSNIIGSSCGDGACEPGEDASYCPKDCASIKPNCGNNVCDPWESETTCRADCEGISGASKACSSNEACGYKQICQSGQCVSVDCTNDAQCGYGKECESNRCKRCPSGPYGPAC